MTSTTAESRFGPLIFAVPKGRILDEALPVMAHAGLVPESAFHDKKDRSLSFATEDGAARILRVRAFDVATFVAFGAAQAGIVGSDVIEEFDYSELYAPVDLGIGKCRQTSGGVMCPSYQATREEQHSTRGRAHLLDDVVVELGEAGEVGGALKGQLLALGGAFAEAVGEQRQGKKGGPEHAGLGIGGFLECTADVRIDALGEHRQCRQRGEQQCRASDQAEAAERDGYRDQHAEPRLHAAARVHDHGDQHDIREYRQLAVHLVAADPPQVQDEAGDGDGDVEIHRQREQARQVGTQWSTAQADEHQQQRDPQRHPVTEVEAQVAALADAGFGGLRGWCWRGATGWRAPSAPSSRPISRPRRKGSRAGARWTSPMR